MKRKILLKKAEQINISKKKISQIKKLNHSRQSPVSPSPSPSSSRYHHHHYTTIITVVAPSPSPASRRWDPRNHFTIAVVTPSPSQSPPSVSFYYFKSAQITVRILLLHFLLCFYDLPKLGFVKCFSRFWVN